MEPTTHKSGKATSLLQYPEFILLEVMPMKFSLFTSPKIMVLCNCQHLLSSTMTKDTNYLETFTTTTIPLLKQMLHFKQEKVIILNVTTLILVTLDPSTLKLTYQIQT